MLLDDKTIAGLRALPMAQAIDYWKALEDIGRKNGDLNGVVRALCCADLFYLLVSACRRVDMLHPWVYQGVREVEANPDGYIDLWSREHFKDLADATPILTANRGWATHGELVVGDKVFAPNGSAVKVIGLSPRFSTSKCYRLEFGDGAEIVAGAGHLWTIRHKIKRRIANSHSRLIEWRYETVTTEILAQMEGRRDVGVAEPLQMPEAKLSIAPYILGAWLGDGNSSGPIITMLWEDAQPLLRTLEKNGHTWRALKTGSRALSFKIDERSRNAVCIRGHVRTPENVYRHACKECKRQYSRFVKFGDAMEPIIVNGLSARLRELNLISYKAGVNKKHIPDVYKIASIEQRMQLLRGLMDTDGCCDVGGTATFANVNLRLAQDVYELAVGLGLRPRFRKVQTQSDAVKAVDGIYVSYHVSFQAHKDRNPFNLERKAARAIDKYLHRGTRALKSATPIESVPTRCIQVEGGLYLAGKELVPTHNSSTITFGLTIQDILKDPEITFGIFSHTRPIAKAFLRQIMRELESNQTLHAAFPDILWGQDVRQAPKWSEDDGVIVRRNSNPNEATIEAWGLVDGQPVSKHFKVLLYDDIVVQASVTTPDMIEKTMSRLEESYSLGTSPGGRRRFCGTRWHFNDAYSTIIKRGTATPRVRPGRVGGTEEGESVYWPEATHREKRRDFGPYVYAAQILLDPKADGMQGFKREWLKSYKAMTPPMIRAMNLYILVDAANAKRKESDYTSGWVLGLNRDKNYYAVELFRDRVALSERTDWLMRTHRKYTGMGCNIVQVRYERYGMMADIDHIKTVQEQENYRFPITEVAGRAPKHDRIKRLQPFFAQGLIYLPETYYMTDYERTPRDLVHDFIEEEYMAFPVSAHLDMLDSLARIFEPDIPLVWPKHSTISMDAKDWRPSVAAYAT